MGDEGGEGDLRLVDTVDGKGGEEKEKEKEKRRNRGKESELGKRRQWREEKRKDERGKTHRMNETVRVRVRITES